MKLPQAKDKGKVFMTCTIEQKHTWENIYPQHILAHIYSGELTITYGFRTLTFVKGDTLLVPKAQLSRSVKTPSEAQPFKCVSMSLPEEQLREFYQGRTTLSTWPEDIAKERPVTPHPLWTSFFSSLLPYFEMQDELPEDLVPIKINEALTIIDHVDKRLSTILGTFGEPGKIDLKKYMEEHYMYNLPLEKFAYLTGRSLTSFKADFKKIFNKTPGKWLMEKRLELAHHKLTTEKKKATAVYLSAGFENLSHFSFAFKKAFGYSPSSIQNNQHFSQL
ncbi:helix-turn-helix domain-containing protein [Marinoscillum furvescens]|uniref:AraC-like DNA-binding protein n=1 Tax=Marinoscillum furvescens DSM 4134 TaxID=1122208 RepID=A0A3D9KYT3_MARFU|nr:AraC family transcriptional regulator [Marinoscillum furvescens]RED93887.1 AraC-like DNA-binding protein [Marinoscillum furvescens DSM 4134]